MLSSLLSLVDVAYRYAGEDKVLGQIYGSSADWHRQPTA